MFELRAAMSLARLWRGQGNCTEAPDLLAPIYGWFTAGFDTVDSKAAKSRLVELSVKSILATASFTGRFLALVLRAAGRLAGQGVTFSTASHDHLVLTGLA